MDNFNYFLLMFTDTLHLKDHPNHLVSLKVLKSHRFHINFFACWVIFHDFLLSADFCLKIYFKKWKSFRSTVIVSNSLDPDYALSGSKLSADNKISQQQMKSSAIDGKYFNKQLPDYRNLDAIVYNFISLLLQEDIAYTRLLCFSTGPPPPKRVLWQTVKTQMKCSIKPYIMACFMLPYIWAISDPVA